MSDRFDIRTPTNIDFKRTLVFTNGGVALDLTGWGNPALKIRDNPGGQTRLSLGPGATNNGSSVANVSPAPAGLMNLAITYLDLLSLPVGFPYIGSYDLIIGDNNAVVRRMMYGSFISWPGDTV